MLKLVEGKIPAYTECHFKNQCPMSADGSCKHRGKAHNVDFSCGAARAFDIGLINVPELVGMRPGEVNIIASAVGCGTTKVKWDEFVKTTQKDFYCCIDRDGTWFDSARTVELAISWCAIHFDGKHDLSIDDRIGWMNTRGRELGISIIHFDMLKKMYDASLLR